MAVLQLPIAVLLHPCSADQAHARVLVGEDADDIRAPFDLLIASFEWICAVRLGAMLGGKGHERQHVVLAVVHRRRRLGPAGAELVGDLPPGRSGGGAIGLQESLPQGRGHHRVPTFADMGQGASRPMNPAAPPRRPEHLGDGTPEPLVRVERLAVAQKQGGRALLTDVNFELARGERLGLVGQSGSGKTTLGLALLGLLPPTLVARGRLTGPFGHIDLAVQTPRPRVLAALFQDPSTSLNPYLTLGEQLVKFGRVGVPVLHRFRVLRHLRQHPLQFLLGLAVFFFRSAALLVVF